MSKPRVTTDEQREKQGGADCWHGRGRILTYNALPYRWIEQCDYCGEVRKIPFSSYDPLDDKP